MTHVSKIEDSAYFSKDTVSECVIDNDFVAAIHLVPKLLIISAQPTATKVSDKT
jgi:hypothetical protein